jgi:hypothetical protein
MYLAPAYGRRYRTEQELLEAWEAGKDFKIVGGPYTSIRDCAALQQECSSLWLKQATPELSVKIG